MTPVILGRVVKQSECLFTVCGVKREVQIDCDACRSNTTTRKWEEITLTKSHGKWWSASSAKMRWVNEAAKMSLTILVLAPDQRRLACFERSLLGMLW